MFRQFLHDGVLHGTAYKPATVRFNATGLSPLFSLAPSFTELSPENLEVRFTFDSKVDDGRFANNGWNGAAVIGRGSSLDVRDSEALNNFEHGMCVRHTRVNDTKEFVFEISSR